MPARVHASHAAIRILQDRDTGSGVTMVKGRLLDALRPIEEIDP
jgi:hypothetical protein